MLKKPKHQRNNKKLFKNSNLMKLLKKENMKKMLKSQMNRELKAILKPFTEIVIKK